MSNLLKIRRAHCRLRTPSERLRGWKYQSNAVAGASWSRHRGSKDEGGPTQSRCQPKEAFTGVQRSKVVLRDGIRTVKVRAWQSRSGRLGRRLGPGRKEPFRARRFSSQPSCEQKQSAGHFATSCLASSFCLFPK